VQGVGTIPEYEPFIAMDRKKVGKLTKEKK